MPNMRPDLPSVAPPSAPDLPGRPSADKRADQAARAAWAAVNADRETALRPERGSAATGAPSLHGPGAPTDPHAGLHEPTATKRAAEHERRAETRQRRRFPAGGPSPTGIARVVHAMARFAARWPKITVGLWVLLIAACLAGGMATGTKSITHEGGSSESGLADARVDAAGLGGSPMDRILIQATPGTVDAVAGTLQRKIAALPAVRSVASPLPSGGGARSMRTSDGRGVLLAVTFRDDHLDGVDQAKPITRVIAQTRQANPGVTITESADGAVDAAVSDVVASDLQRAERLSVPLTLLILVLAFGAFVAATVPLVLGVTAVAGAMGALGMISQLVPNSDSTGSLVVLIGLAVGVDYSLFYVRREREERRRGLGEGAALAAAAASVGRAILVSGFTVMVALAGLLLTGNAVFESMGVGTITVVAIALLGSLTVLPAMLTLLGDRVEAGRLGLPGAKRRRARRAATRAAAQALTAAESTSASAEGDSLTSAPTASTLGRTRAGRRTAWAIVADRVTRAPKRSLAAALLVLLALAIPATSMRLGQGGIESLPKGVPAIDAERTLAEAFPGAGDAADFVVTGARLGSAPARHGLQALGARALRATGGAGQVPVTISRDARTAIVRVPLPDHGPQASQRAIEHLRATVSPLAADLVPGATGARITGDAAGGLDFANQVKHAMPVVGAFVLGLAFVLLMLAFRSWPLALAVIGLNLASVGAAYGVMTAVFQHTWAESLLGFTSNGSITTWLPLLAFVILFGLSMDYSILVLERIREARHAGRSPREAAAEGVAATASTVTSAAIVMVFVFAIFATLRLLEMKQLGVGLAAAILIDATIVRAFALPAAVTLLGERAFPVKAATASRGTRDAPADRPVVDAPFRGDEDVCDDGSMARPALLATRADG